MGNIHFVLVNKGGCRNSILSSFLFNAYLIEKRRAKKAAEKQALTLEETPQCTALLPAAVQEAHTNKPNCVPGDITIIEAFIDYIGVSNE